MAGARRVNERLPTQTGPESGTQPAQETLAELTQFTLLRGFSEAELHALSVALETRDVAAGETLFRAGECSVEVYLIRVGAVEVLRERATGEHAVTVLGPGHEVGELAMLDGAPRSATARTTRPTRLFVLHPSRLPITLRLINRLLGNTALACARKLREAEPERSEPPDAPDFPALADFPLWRGLAPEERAALGRHLQPRSLVAGEYLFHEGAPTREVFFLLTGTLEIRKRDSLGAERVITTLGPGREVGELALIDGAPRSASARAVSPCELWSLGADGLTSNLILLSRFAGNLSQAGAEKLRQSNTAHVQSLERELAAERDRNHFGQFFLYTMTMLIIGTLVTYLLHTSLRFIDVSGEFFKWVFLLVLLVPSWILIRTMGIPLHEIGITRHNATRSLREGVLASLIAVPLFLLLLSWLRGQGMIPPEPWDFNPLRSMNYVVHSFLQELLARGITQTAFQRFFNDQRGVKSVFLTSLLFGLFHIHFGLIAVAIVFVASLGFGAFYLRHHNLIGVSIFHVAIGTCAFASGLL